MSAIDIARQTAIDAGFPSFADELSGDNSVICRPLRQLTRDEANVLVKCWRAGYKAAGLRFCPSSSYLCGDCERECDGDCCPDFDNEKVAAEAIQYHLSMVPFA